MRHTAFQQVCKDTAPGVDLSISLTRIEVVVRRHVLDIPVVTSFGTMTNRPALFLRVTDQSGTVGYGEVWCNFPACGAEHRAALLLSEIAPRVDGRSFADPAALYDWLRGSTHILGLQTGEQGPLSQIIAGVDGAVWDMISRRAGLPLYRVLGGSSGKIELYASGINPQGVGETADRLLAEGYRKLKLKVGFGADLDTENVETISQKVNGVGTFMLDANQGWDVETASTMMARLAPFGPTWIEEPLAVDRPVEDCKELKSVCDIPIAGGENFATFAAYKAALSTGVLDILQPDLNKWGGVTGATAVARAAVAAGKTYCPHFLGGGVGLAASAHVLAACGNGLLEVDSNPNPLRSDLFPISPIEGEIALPDAPGIGIDAPLLSQWFAEFG